MVAPFGLPPLGLSEEAPDAPTDKPIRMVRTPRGWKAFDMIFQSKLGAPLRETLQQAIRCSIDNKATPMSEKHRALFVHVRDRLVGMLVHDQDLIAELAEHCDIDNGVDQYMYLQTGAY